MRAAVLEEAGKPVVIRQDVEIAAPKAGQVSVEVRHCGLCHSDLSIIDGVFPGMMPLVLGHEAAGVVAEVGPGVTSRQRRRARGGGGVFSRAGQQN